MFWSQFSFRILRAKIIGTSGRRKVLMLWLHLPRAASSKLSKYFEETFGFHSNQNQWKSNIWSLCWRLVGDSWTVAANINVFNHFSVRDE